MARAASSSGEDLPMDGAGAYDNDGVDTDDEDEEEDDDFEEDGFEDDGLEAEPFDEEAEMQKLIAEVTSSGKAGTESSDSPLAQLDSSIDILDRDCHDTESSHSHGQKANEHVDSFVRSWCSLLAPKGLSSTSFSRRGGPPAPRFELFVARLHGLRADSTSGKARWIYSDDEVASASELTHERSNSSSSGYVGVGELQHFMCLCKFLATTPSVGEGSEGDSSDDDDDCDWAALTPAAFRQRFAASLTTAAADAAGAHSGAEVPVYVPPMSRERFLELYDHFDVGEEVIESPETSPHATSPPTQPAANSEAASRQCLHEDISGAEDASSDDEDVDDGGKLASSGGGGDGADDTPSTNVRPDPQYNALHEGPPSPERQAKQEMFGRGSPGRSSNGGRRYTVAAPLAGPAVHRDSSSSSSDDGDEENDVAINVENGSNAAASAVATSEAGIGVIENMDSSIKEAAVAASSNVGGSSSSSHHHHHWLGEPSDDFEEVYSEASMAAASYSGLRSGREPPLDSLSESSSGATISHNSSSHNSSGFMASSWQRAPLAANLAVLGDRGTAISLEVCGLKLPQQDVPVEGPGNSHAGSASVGGGVVFDATILASALQLALLANADCAEVLQEMAGSSITVSDNNDSVDVMSSHSSVTKNSKSIRGVEAAAVPSWQSNREQSQVERSNDPGATDGSGASVQSSTSQAPPAALLRWGAGSQVELAQCAEPGLRRLVRLRCSRLPPAPNLKWLLNLLNYAPPPQQQPLSPQAPPPVHPSNDANGLLPPPLPSAAIAPSTLLLEAPSLPVRSTLRHLELVGCGISDSMLVAAHSPLQGEVSSILDHLDTLESLDLTDNALTHPPLQLPPRLRSLKLASNRLNTLAFLEKRGSLRALDASHNSGLTGFAQLFTLTPLKDTLTALHLSSCPLVETTPNYRRSVANLIPALEVLDGNPIHRTGSYTAARSAAVAHQATTAAGAARKPSRRLGQHLAPSSSSAHGGSKHLPAAHAAAMAAAAAATAQATHQAALSQHVSSYGYAANAGGMGAIKVLQTAGFGRQKPSDSATASATAAGITPTRGMAGGAGASTTASETTAHPNHHHGAVFKPHPKDLTFSLDGSKFARPASAAAAAALAAAQARELPPLPEELAADEFTANDRPEEAVGSGDTPGATSTAAPPRPSDAYVTPLAVVEPVQADEAKATTFVGASSGTPVEHHPTAGDTSESELDDVPLEGQHATKRTSTGTGADESSTSQEAVAGVRVSRSSGANSSDEDGTRAMSRARSIGLARALGGRLSPDASDYARGRTPSWAHGDPRWVAATATSPTSDAHNSQVAGGNGSGGAGSPKRAMDHEEAEAEATLMAAEAQLLEELKRLDQQHTSSRSRSRPTGGSDGRHHYHHHYHPGGKHAIAQAHANGWMPASNRRRNLGGVVPLPLEVTFAAQHAPPNSSTTADDDNASCFLHDDDDGEDDRCEGGHDQDHHRHRPGEQSLQSNLTNDVSMRDTGVSDFTVGSTIGELGGHYHTSTSAAASASLRHPSQQRVSRSPLRGIIGGGSDTDGGLGDTIRDSFSRSRSRQNSAHAINAASAHAANASASSGHPPFRPSGPGGSAFSGPGGSSSSYAPGGGGEGGRNYRSASRTSASPPSSLARPSSTSLARRASPSRAPGPGEIIGGDAISQAMHSNEGASRQAKEGSKLSKAKKKKAKTVISTEFANHEVSAADGILHGGLNKAPTSSDENANKGNNESIGLKGIDSSSSSVPVFLAGCGVASEALAAELAELGAFRASDLVDLTRDEATAAGVAAGLRPLEARRFDAALLALQSRHRQSKAKKKKSKKVIGRERAAGEDNEDDDDDDEDDENVGSASNRPRSTHAPRRLSRKSRASRRSARHEKRLPSNNGALSDSASSATGGLGGGCSKKNADNNTFGLGHGERHGDSSDGTTPKGWPSMVFTKRKNKGAGGGHSAAARGGENGGVLSPLSGLSNGQNSTIAGAAGASAYANEPASASTHRSQDFHGHASSDASSVFERLHALWKLKEEHRSARAQELFELETKALTFSPDRASTADYHSKPAAQKREQQRKAVALREKVLKRQATARSMAQKQRQARRSVSAEGRLPVKQKHALDAPHGVGNNRQPVGFGSSSRGHDGSSSGGHFTSGMNGKIGTGGPSVKFTTTATTLPAKAGFLSATKASLGKDATAASDSDPLWREVDRQGTPLAKKAWAGSAIAQGTTLRSTAASAAISGGKTSVSPQRRSSTAKAHPSSSHIGDASMAADGNAPSATVAAAAGTVNAGAESPMLSETPERRNLADKLAAAGNSAGRSSGDMGASGGGFDSSSSAWAGAGRQALEGALAEVKREVEAHAKALSSHTKGVSRLQKAALSAAAAKLGLQVGSLATTSDSEDAAADGETSTSSTEITGVDLVAWKVQAQVLDGQLRSERARLASLLTALHESSAAAAGGGGRANLPHTASSGPVFTPTSISSSSSSRSQGSSNDGASSTPLRRCEGYTSALPPFLSPIADGGEESSGPESAGPASRRRSPHPPNNNGAWSPASEDASKAALAALLRGLPPRSSSHSGVNNSGDGGGSGSGGSSYKSSRKSPELSTPTPSTASAVAVPGPVAFSASTSAATLQTPAALESAPPFTAETFRALTSPPVSNRSGRSERAVTLEELATSDLVVDDEALEDNAEGLRRSTDLELQPYPEHATDDVSPAAGPAAAARGTVPSNAPVAAPASSGSGRSRSSAAAVTESNKKISADSDRMLTMLSALRAQEAAQGPTRLDDSNTDADNSNSTSAVTDSVVALAVDSTFLTGASRINTTEEQEISHAVNDSNSDLSAVLEGFEEAAMAARPPNREPRAVPPPGPRVPAAHPSSSSSAAAPASTSSAAAQRVVAEVPGAQASVPELNSVLERLHEIEATKARRARRARQLKRMGGSDASSEALLMRAGSGRGSGSETDGAASAVETAEELDAEQRTLEIWLLSLELSPSSEL